MGSEEVSRDVPLWWDVLIIRVANYDAHSSVVTPELNVPEAKKRKGFRRRGYVACCCSEGCAWSIQEVCRYIGPIEAGTRASLWSPMGVFPPRRVKGTKGIRKAAKGMADGAHARNAKWSCRVEASR